MPTSYLVRNPPDRVGKWVGNPSRRTVNVGKSGFWKRQVFKIEKISGFCVLFSELWRVRSEGATASFTAIFCVRPN